MVMVLYSLQGIVTFDVAKIEKLHTLTAVVDDSTKHSFAVFDKQVTFIYCTYFEGNYGC